jgi:hypothetical protein
MNAPAEDLTLAMLRTGVRIADQAVVADIETNTVLLEDELGTRWHDITSMLSEHEQPPEFIDMNAEALAWAIARGLVLQHPLNAHLVRIVRRP